jgi:hypothetical protein
MSDNTGRESSHPVGAIELPKPKRVYKKKQQVPEPIVPEPVTIAPEPIQELPPVEPESSPKPKRVYKRKAPVVETVPPVDIPVEVPVEVPLELPTVPVTKKPRTEKQIQAFNKMREARIKKQQELEDLKAFQKEQVLLEKEQAKLEKVEEQIIKKKAARKPRASLSPGGSLRPQGNKQVDSDNEQVPQVNNVSTHKVLLFV